MVISDLVGTAVTSDSLPLAANGAKVGKVRGIFIAGEPDDSAKSRPALIVQGSDGRYNVLKLSEVQHADRATWAGRDTLPGAAEEEGAALPS